MMMLAMIDYIRELLVKLSDLLHKRQRLVALPAIKK